MGDRRWAIESQPSDTEFRDDGSLERKAWELPLEEEFLEDDDSLPEKSGLRPARHLAVHRATMARARARSD